MMRDCRRFCECLLFCLFLVIASCGTSTNGTTPPPSDTTPPSAPAGLAAPTVTSTSITLNWTASTDNVAVTGYRIERCSGASCSNFAQIGTSTGNSYQDTTVAASTSYTYRVRATDAAGNLSNYSNTISKTTSAAADTTPPSAPSNLTAPTVTSSSITLNWTASTDNVGVTGYRIERCSGASCSNFAQVGTPSGNTYQDTTVAASTSYTYRVRATDAAGNLSNYSNTVSATTPSAADTTPPSAPANLATTAVTSTSISLSWTASTDNVGVTGYKVERCSGASCTSFAQIGTPTSTTYQDTSLASSTTFRYRVRATDAAGNLSAYSNILNATTSAPADTTAPSVPTGLTATATSATQINLSWTASTDNVGVTGYKIYRGGTQIATSTATSYSNTGLSPNTGYSYTVAAYDAAGNTSAQSTAATATTLAASGPTYPIKVSANGRYLVDQNNTPFLMVGDSPHSLIVNLSLAEADTYMTDRAAHGINTLWVEILSNTYTANNNTNGSNGATYDGITPFTNSNDISTPNPAYFTRVDQMVNLAASKGITVLLDAFETYGWYNFLQAQTDTKMFNWGVFLGNRYKNFPNIIWITGNDFQTWNTSSADNSKIKNLMAGIASVDTNHIQTLQLDYPVSGSLDDSLTKPYVDTTGAYTYYPTYDKILDQYNKATALTTPVPVFLEEAHYENEAHGGCCGEAGTPGVLRRQAYWTVLSGGVAGQMYGNYYTWTFTSGWQVAANLDTTGVTEMGYWKNLFTTLPWYNLVPDQAHAVVTAGYGTYDNTSALQGNTYVTTASTADGKLVMSYVPEATTLTVNMTKLSGSVTARWFDPTNGSFATVSGSPFANTGTRTFTSPGNNSSGDHDWVLILQAP